MRRVAALVVAASLAALTGILGAPSAHAGGGPAASFLSSTCTARGYVVLFMPHGRTETVRGETGLSSPFVELYAETRPNDNRTGLRFLARSDDEGDTGVAVHDIPCKRFKAVQAVGGSHQSGLEATSTDALLTCTVRDKATAELWSTSPNSNGSDGLSLRLGSRPIFEVRLERSGPSPSSASFNGKACKKSAAERITCDRPPAVDCTREQGQ